jgi:hypothetical protein
MESVPGAVATGSVLFFALIEVSLRSRCGELLPGFEHLIDELNLSNHAAF